MNCDCATYIQSLAQAHKPVQYVGMQYARQHLLPLLSPTEVKLLSKLSSPHKIQDYLDHFPENFAPIGEAIQSPSKVIANKRAHCIEGAILAASALACHGSPALLLDLQASDADEDHVLALYKVNGLWGAISKTNHPVLRWRDPVYKDVRELAMSYFNEYFLFDASHFGKKVAASKLGTKTLRAYSKPFDLMQYNPADWWAAGDLDWLAEKLDSSRHFPILPNSAIKNLRKASAIEIKAAALEEWKNS